MARVSDIGSLVQTGAGAKWRGIEAVGGAIGQVGSALFQARQHRRNVDARLQHADATSGTAGFVNNILRSLDKAVVKSDDQRELILNGIMDDIDRFRENKRKELDNDDALGLEEISYAADREGYKTAVYRALSGQLQKHQWEFGSAIGESLVKAGRLNEAIDHYNFLAKEGIITASRADMLKKQAPAEVAYQEIINDPENMDNIIKKYPQLTTAQKEQLWQKSRLVLSNLALERARQKKALEAQQEIDMDVFNDILVDISQNKPVDLTKVMEALDNSSLNEDQQRQYASWINAEAKRKAAGEDIISNKAVASALKDRARRIETGAGDADRILKDTRIARYSPDVPMDKRIDDTDFASVASLVQTELGQAISRKESFQLGIARNTLVPLGEESALEKRLARRRQELRRQIKDEDKAERLYQQEEKRILDDREIQFQIYDKFADDFDKEIAKLDEEKASKDQHLTPDDVYSAYQKLMTHYRDVTVDQMRKELERPQQKTSPAPPTPPLPEKVLTDAVGKENAQMEIKAWGVLYDAWDSFPLKLQNAIRISEQQGKSYTEIMMFDEVAKELEELVK